MILGKQEAERYAGQTRPAAQIKQAESPSRFRLLYETEQLQTVCDMSAPHVLSGCRSDQIDPGLPAHQKGYVGFKRILCFT